jgi:hypothetical protein
MERRSLSLPQWACGQLCRAGRSCRRMRRSPACTTLRPRRLRLFPEAINPTTLRTLIRQEPQNSIDDVIWSYWVTSGRRLQRANPALGRYDKHVKRLANYRRR